MRYNKEVKSFVSKIFPLLLGLALFVPLLASAHEVYVLSPTEIQNALSMTSPDPLTAITSHERLFLLYGVGGFIIFVLLLAVSVSSVFERVLDPFLKKLKKYAPFIGRITLGISLIASGYFGDSFGPELPLGSVVRNVSALSAFLMLGGFLILIGCLTRYVAMFGVIFFAVLVFHYHAYMLNYVNYLGEMLLASILGGGKWSLDRSLIPLVRLERMWQSSVDKFEKYAFLILRILFGTAVVFASFYAKFLHSNLALDTVRDYHLTNYFPFTPLFLVLGAFLVEAVIGFCFLLGFQIRFAAILFTFFLTLSILFFGEAVWPHIILFGVNFALFAHGYDVYTLETALFQRKRVGEPVF